jgi:hypothetical protein
MSVEALTQEDSDFLAYYGRTMVSVQEFEFAMVRLARLILPELSKDAPFEPAWNRMERQFKKADGPLAKPLVEAGHAPREILREIQRLLAGRKNLAHEYLLSYMLERDAGVVDRAERISILEGVETSFLRWRDFIDALYEAVARERGVTPEAVDFTLDDIRETFEQQDTHELLSAYGRAMHAVQLWELSLKRLLVFVDLPGDDDDTTFDEDWEPVEGTPTAAAGLLGRKLKEWGYGPQDLHEELEAFKDHRNELAHNFFVDYARIQMAEGPRAHGAALLKFLEAMHLLFSEQRTRLDELSDAQARERGWELKIALRDDEPSEER